MNLNDVPRRGKPGLPGDTGELFHKFGGDVFFDSAAVVADREDRGVVMPVTLARHESVERFESMHATAVGESCKCAIDRRRRKTRIFFAQASEHLIGGHRSATTSQDSQQNRLHLFSTLVHRNFSPIVQTALLIYNITINAQPESVNLSPTQSG